MTGESAAISQFIPPANERPSLERVAELERRIEQLTHERNRFQQMVDSLPDPVIITDASNAIVVRNKRAEYLLFAADTDSAARRRAAETNNQFITAFLSRAATPGAPIPARLRQLSLVDPDEAHDLLFEVLTHSLGERAGPDDARLSVLRDVTDLRRAAGELERQVQRVRQAEIDATEERDRLNLILENVADPILVTDSAANPILLNEAAEQLFHGPRSAPHSYRVSQAVRQNDTKFTSFITEFAASDERTRRARMQLVHPVSSIELPVEVVSGKIRNDRGEPMAVVTVLHDLTQQADNERLYEALKQLNSELEGRIAAATADLAQQNERLLWQSEELGKASKLKSDFLANMSHELRTPLNAVIGYSELLIDGIPGKLVGRQLDYVVRSRAAAQHLLSLINDILDLARIEAGRMPLNIESVRVDHLILEVSQHIAPMVSAKNLTFSSDVSVDCAIIETDKTKVKQILLNLLANAVKFTNRGEVRITAQCAGRAVVIEVHDTGVGMKPEELETIWEDFRQLDQSRTRSFGGTGLGLSITRRLTHQLGGQVTVSSEFGEGTTFSVRLPLSIRG